MNVIIRTESLSKHYGKANGIKAVSARSETFEELRLTKDIPLANCIVVEACYRGFLCPLSNIVCSVFWPWGKVSCGIGLGRTRRLSPSTGDRSL